MPSKTPRRPRDPNQLAKLILDLSTGAATEEPPKKKFSSKGGTACGSPCAHAEAVVGNSDNES